MKNGFYYTPRLARLALGEYHCDVGDRIGGPQDPVGTVPGEFIRLLHESGEVLKGHLDALNHNCNADKLEPRSTSERVM